MGGSAEGKVAHVSLPPGPDNTNLILEIFAAFGTLLGGVGSALALVYRDSAKRADEAIKQANENAGQWRDAFYKSQAITEAMKESAAKTADLSAKAGEIMQKVLDRLNAIYYSRRKGETDDDP